MEIVCRSNLMCLDTQVTIGRQLQSLKVTRVDI